MTLMTIHILNSYEEMFNLKVIPIEAAPHDVMQALDHYHKAKKL